MSELKLIECKNTRCWAHSTFHGKGCMLNLINGCETNGVSCKQSESYTASIVIHTLETEIEKLKNELQIERDRANALELVAARPCKDCKRSDLVREAVLVGKSYGAAQINGKLSPSLKEINDWLISEGIKPFGEVAKQRYDHNV